MFTALNLTNVAFGHSLFHLCFHAARLLIIWDLVTYMILYYYYHKLLPLPMFLPSPHVSRLSPCPGEGFMHEYDPVWILRLMVSFVVKGAPHRIHPETANLQTGLVLWSEWPESGEKWCCRVFTFTLWGWVVIGETESFKLTILT